jgi:hypothetical protein
MARTDDAIANSYNSLMLSFEPPDGPVEMRVLGGLPVVGVAAVVIELHGARCDAGLSKTCRKLRLSLIDYLGDRLQLNGGQPSIPPLAVLVTQA